MIQFMFDEKGTLRIQKDNVPVPETEWIPYISYLFAENGSYETSALRHRLLELAAEQFNTTDVMT